MSRQSSPNPYFFIMGCPRSGTTLLERMVDAHPQLAVIHETHWITRFYKKRIGMTDRGFVTEDMIPALTEHHRFRNLRMEPEDVERLVRRHSPRTYSEFISALFDLYGRREGKALVGDKTTGGYLRSMPLLHELWPGARFVHLIRDGRNVCLSMLDWPKAHRAVGRLEIWNDHPVGATALWWKWHVVHGLAGRFAIGPDLCHEIRFESFIADAAETCSTLCAFLGVENDDAMTRFNEGRARPDRSDLSANQAWLSPTPGLRDWRTQMKPEDIELFETLAGDVLEVLGYPLSDSAASAGIIATARELQQWWDERHAPLPDADWTDRIGHEPVGNAEGGHRC